MHISETFSSFYLCHKNSHIGFSYPQNAGSSSIIRRIIYFTGSDMHLNAWSFTYNPTKTTNFSKAIHNVWNTKCAIVYESFKAYFNRNYNQTSTVL